MRLFWDIVVNGHFLLGTDFASAYLGMKQFLYHEIHRFHS